jgi:hypothetical protein
MWKEAIYKDALHRFGRRGTLLDDPDCVENDVGPLAPQYPKPRRRLLDINVRNNPSAG